jgi:hypothetical protein
MHDADDRNRSTSDDEEHPPPRREVIIDVSEREPVVVEREPEFPFAGYAPERVRVFVAGGNRRTCAIPIILILLALCCACLGFWVVADNLF